MQLNNIHHAYDWNRADRHAFNICADIPATPETGREEYRAQGTHIADVLYGSLPGATVQQISERLAFRLTHDEFGNTPAQACAPLNWQGRAVSIADFPGFLLFQGARFEPESDRVSPMADTGEPSVTYQDVENSGVRAILRISGEIIPD